MEVSTWSVFRERWDGITNFLMSGDCVPFSFDMPEVEDVVETLRQDNDARIWRGSKGSTIDKTDISEEFRKLSIEQAVRSPFQLSHFKLEKFFGEGQLLAGFHEQVMQCWQGALQEAGFTWSRCYPILFVSGPHSATNYHMDVSHVLAWQISGSKTFSGLVEPRRWAPIEERLKSQSGVDKPEGITEQDVLAYRMNPGSVLWNCFLTPHWVEASDKVAYSVNISHGGLMLDGKLCPHEEEWTSDCQRRQLAEKTLQT